MKSYPIYPNLAKIRAKVAKNLEFFLLKSKNGPPKSSLNQNLYTGKIFEKSNKRAYIENLL